TSSRKGGGVPNRIGKNSARSFGTTADPSPRNASGCVALLMKNNGGCGRRWSGLTRCRRSEQRRGKTLADRQEYEVFEVFVRKKKTDAHVHVGSLNAPSPDIALTTARENFLRRENAVNLWVVPRGEIHETPCDEGDWFARELDRKYREVSGYSEN